MNCICTLYDDNFKSFIPYVLKSFDIFAETYDFKPRYFDQLITQKMAPPWNKIHAVIQCFTKGYDWVFWADADSLFIGGGTWWDYSSDFVISSDANGICSSHMLLKNTKYNRQLLETLLFLGDVTDETQFGIGVKWEQNALKALRRFFNVPLTTFPVGYVGEPAYPNTVLPTTQFLHFATLTMEKRLQMIAEHYRMFYG